MLVLRNTNARITHSKLKNQVTCTPSPAVHRNLNLTLLGKFDRVADKVGEYLAQSGRISHQHGRHVGTHVIEALDTLLVST